MSEKDRIMAKEPKKPPLSKEELEDLREELMLADSILRIQNVLMVLSGKGGVGKSAVAVNLAATLAAADREVGLLDIDIQGPSVPTMLNLEGASAYGGDAKGLTPVPYSERLKVMSIDFVAGEERNQALVWRSPMKHRLMTEFISEVEWGPLDYLVIDAPPGTGDEPLSICQMAPPHTKAILVTTPQELALKDVRKSIQFCKLLGVPVFGIIENMSGFVCPSCGAEHDLFKRGGGESLARETGFRFLGRIPIDPRMVTISDEGKPYVLEYPDSLIARAFDEIAAPILELAPLRMKKH
jgi:ATP-binding protein involved in chromosome partitioning